MKHWFTICILLTGVFTGTAAQKSRVLAVFQMIDQGKYEEAREAIELAVWNDKTSRWYRTYYAKGLLCQTAYEEGYPKKDKKKTTLYPDQLYVAYASYEKALDLDNRKKLKPVISTKYYLLSNDFRTLGQDLFQAGDFKNALRAFEHALLINNNELISEKPDTNLVYNTALAAYESKNWDKAIGFLTGLHENAHAPSTSLLLSSAYLESGDSAMAEQVLVEGFKLHKKDEQLVFRLINLYVETGRVDQAIRLLEEAIANQPENHRLKWGEGLIYIKLGEYDKAIQCFKDALEEHPDEPRIYYHLGVIYFNQGIDLLDASLKVKNNEAYLKMRDQAQERFKEALSWLEKSYELDPDDEKTISLLNQLYSHLKMKGREKNLKP